MSKVKSFSVVLWGAWTLITVSIGCGSDGPTAASPEEDEETVSLETILTTPGNVISLPASGADSVDGLVVDSTGNGVGDGMDIDGNGLNDILYGSLETNKTGVKSEATPFPFSFDDDAREYYFCLDEFNEVVMGRDTNCALRFTIVVGDGEILGVDYDDDGTIDREVLPDTVLFTFNSGYAGSCLIETNSGATTIHQCLDFTGAGYSADEAQELCLNFYGSSAAYSAEDPCSQTNATGFCEVQHSPLNQNGYNPVYSYNHYTYNDHEGSSIQDYCEEREFNWNTF